MPRVLIYVHDALREYDCADRALSYAAAARRDVRSE